MIHWRLVLLILVLVGLFVWVWATDEPSPAYGQGRFWSLLAETAVIVVIVAAGIGAWRDWRSYRKSNAQPPA
jgi:uncharacterized membrane protein YphA (DoxX/SURF4 family)